MDNNGLYYLSHLVSSRHMWFVLSVVLCYKSLAVILDPKMQY